MEIIKYKKTKGNLYELEIDNGTILKLYDDTIMYFSLLLNKKIDHQLLTEITKYNDNLDAYYLSLNYLNKKMRSHQEIETYLKKKEFNQSVIDLTIKKLEQDGYLNRQKFITSYVNDQLNLTMNGPDKIKFNLIKLGFNEDEIVIDYNFEDKILKLIDKKVKLNKKLSNNALKINVANYLVNLGYSKELFANYLDDIRIDNLEMLKKDYNILYKKYHQKYQDNKLNLFIRDKLYKKGYNIDEINEVINNDY